MERMREGIESQAYQYELGPRRFVIRIGRSLRGFEKDRWAAVTLAGRVPAPRVLELGTLDEGPAYCISEWMEGDTLAGMV